MLVNKLVNQNEVTDIIILISFYHPRVLMYFSITFAVFLFLSSGLCISVLTLISITP